MTNRITESDIEEFAIELLERLGYQITAHTSSVKALEVFRASPDKFDMVITDMAMPVLPGDQLSAELIKIRPDIKVLLCSGFSERLNHLPTETLGIKRVLMKPIVRKELAETIRQVLDAE